ncbi:uncharacterized protein BT62DRAFT_900952 [Guyanagaster necrorhizus]|uniref:FAR-17a/AIG1-like protein n=1 Tax=Guyanagaster necrorhizus TaxID=856835 RepID=A0A9P8AQK3_9AGAR|nr:uncharacterized protein BT62DRAFT_900952 [Guyanagaster necrorhizus MCA 3950]KAG7444080.1 hypothetical protein BT62DRAFT_900952 [Guyanagaster necrorhizus MCA 3950]
MNPPPKPSLFDSENAFVTSPLFSARILACLRLLWGSYALFTLLFTLIWIAVRVPGGASTNRYFSYLTRLHYTGICAWFFASGVQTAFYASADGGGRYPLRRWGRVLQVLHEWLFSTVVTMPFTITLTFFILLRVDLDASVPFDLYSNISMHVFNSVFALFEILLTNDPPPAWKWLPVNFLIWGAYFGVAYITHEDVGLYPYYILDRTKVGGRGVVAAYILGIIGVYGVTYVVVHGVAIARRRLVDRLAARKDGDGDEEREEEKCSMQASEIEAA